MHLRMHIVEYDDAASIVSETRHQAGADKARAAGDENAMALHRYGRLFNNAACTRAKKPGFGETGPDATLPVFTACSKLLISCLRCSRAALSSACFTKP